MASKPRGIRFSAEGWAQAEEAAARARLSLSAWLERAAKGTADLERALAALEERRSQPVPLPGGGSDGP